ncbi:MAG: HAD family hydrolase [Bacteroidota bacterium]
MDIDKIKVVAFDADDTLWHNERYFREAEDQFAQLVGEYLPKEEAINVLFSHEMKHLAIYGYGIKGFVLSMVETAITISKDSISSQKIQQILEIGRNMMNKPVELLDGVERVFEALKTDYRLILATKGDLIDQERKLNKSGLEHHFHHIEVMSEKKEADYKRLIGHLDIEAHEFLMIGNSMKSDIVPVLNIGGNAIHIPHEITWQHEIVDKEDINKHNFLTLDKVTSILPHLKK